ncbi:cytochrome c oxidase accessory protein CcoG [Membranihabitans marinus]
MNNDHLYQDLYDKDESFRDSLSTIDQQGKRIWVYPKKPKGPLYQYRKYISYLLLLVLFAIPWIKINGQPLFLFNILEGKFILFGIYFGPQDFHLFVIGMLILMVFIVLFTVVFGRVFCGWVCPQTIFMEMVFRRIEYWIEGDYKAQKRLNKAPWTAEKIMKKGSKQIIFFSISVLISNTFLAYFIGSDALVDIITDPIQQHLSGFISMVIFSAVFYAVFSVLREQVCTTICPYGRLQGVLLTENSLAVQYDHVRGEPRGKIHKNQDQSQKGDCIDCNLCVHVCPTGIDIRNGIQLECVNCTACIDACNDVMTKIDKPKGLIRIDSLNGIETGVRSIVNKRSIAYSMVLVVLIILQVVLFINRSDVEALILRTPGTLYYENSPDTISNLYNYQLINKTDKEYSIQFKIANIDAEIEFVGEEPSTLAQQTAEGAMFIKIPKSILTDRKTNLNIEVYHDDELIDKTKTVFLGPLK